jgi:hypothetical protein
LNINIKCKIMCCAVALAFYKITENTGNEKETLFAAETAGKNDRHEHTIKL